MPLYSFEEVKTGRKVEVFMHMSEAVPIGDEVTLAGNKLRRLPETSQHRAAKRNICFEDVQMAPWHPHASRYSEDGQAQFDSKKEVLEFTARCRDHGEEVFYDDE